LAAVELLLLTKPPEISGGFLPLFLPLLDSPASLC
jgi:hypothetical protein